MNIHNEKDLLRLVQEDIWMMDILKTASSLHLPDWWVCAGFVRSKIWDAQHGYRERTPLADIDFIYFDSTDILEETEKHWEAELSSLYPGLPWSVKNQARMHTVNGVPPYASAIDGISKFPETATALGLSLNENNNLILAAPHGIADAVNMVIRPTPQVLQHSSLQAVYAQRILKKNWKALWPQLQVLPMSRENRTLG